jgi:hypothetical protein
MTLKSLLVLIHVISMLSWLGAMYFNLTLLFPMYRSRPQALYAELMQEQGARAAPLLYLLIFATALSGVALAVLDRTPLDSAFLMGEALCWAVMLCCHLYGSLSIWPRVFLALSEEKGRLFFIYKISMFTSAAAGTAAVAFAYLKNTGI